MSNEKLSALPVANPTADADLLYTVQGGTSKKTTALDIKNYIGAGAGNLKVIGGWDASTNTPALASSVGTPWEAYVVITGGNTALDSVKSWAVDDILWFNGTNNQWQRLTNAQYSYPLAVVGIFDAVTGDAADCNFQPIGTLTSGVGIPWQAYGVANPGNYDLDGNVDWKIGQVAMFNGITKQWFKFPILGLNNRTGAFETFPATQGEIMFGSADNWIDQDGNLFWDKTATILKLGSHTYSGGQRSLLMGDSTNTNTDVVDSISILGKNSSANTITTSATMPGDGNTHQNLTNCLSAPGESGTISGCLKSAILPGFQNNFENLENCVAGGGFSNVVKKGSQGVFLGNGAINIDLISGFSWNCILTSTQINGGCPSFTSIRSTNIYTGDTSVIDTAYIHANDVQNNNNLSNLLVMGNDNSSSFVPDYPNQATLFYDNGLSINRPNAGTGGLITTSVSTQNVSTTWPLFNYQMTQNDSIVRGKYAGGAGINALDLVLPIETDLPDGRECEYWNDSTILPAVHTVQSGTAKQIRMNGVANITQDINFVGCVFKFIWCKSDNYWICQRVA